MFMVQIHHALNSKERILVLKGS